MFSIERPQNQSVRSFLECARLFHALGEFICSVCGYQYRCPQDISERDPLNYCGNWICLDCGRFGSSGDFFRRMRRAVETCLAREEELNEQDRRLLISMLFQLDSGESPRDHEWEAFAKLRKGLEID